MEKSGGDADFHNIMQRNGNMCMVQTGRIYLIGLGDVNILQIDTSEEGKDASSITMGQSPKW